MESIIVLFALVIGLVGLDAASLFWGVDSREAMTDDHRR